MGFGFRSATAIFSYLGNKLLPTQGASFRRRTVKPIHSFMAQRSQSCPFPRHEGIQALEGGEWSLQASAVLTPGNSRVSIE